MLSNYSKNNSGRLINYSFPILLLLFCVHKVGGQCAWEYNGTTSVTCHLRLLESTTDLSGAIGTGKLIIQCNDVHLFESQLPTKSFLNEFKSLNELKIQSCKLLQLKSDSFTGLHGLKRLSIQTDNADWSYTKTLDIHNESFSALRELISLELTNNNLRSIPDAVLCPLVNLQVLNLTVNRIRSVDHLGFSDRTNCNGGGGGELQLLDLSYNEIHSISSDWGIKSLRRLQQLLIQFNNISSISSDSLNGLTSLRILNLSYNHLESLPDGLFATSKDLRELHLQHNELFELPKGLFHRLEQLLVLDLSGNQLSSHHVGNATFSGLIRLIVLNLAHNALTRIDSKTFKELYFLQILDLRNNSIGHVENDAFLPLYNLHTLNLAENRLHTLDDRLLNGLYVLSKLTLNNNLISLVEQSVFKNCSDLKELDLSSNQLTSVPEAIQDLSALRTLDLGENQISTFENGSFKNLDQLTGLRLIDNQIGNITKGMFWDLPRLSVLNLAKNRIQGIERGAFEKNVEIEAIRLDRNFISDINGVFATLASLLWLNLSENHLVWFDYAFIPSNLKWLDIHGNYIEELGNYYKLQEEIRVKTLDASHNRITDIGPMSVPNSIELLFINNNQIQTIHGNTFVDKAALARVDLYANALSKLQMYTLRIAPVSQPEKPLPEFYLGGNPFECDCSMEWLQRINNLTSRMYPRVMDLPNIDCIMPHSRGAVMRQLSQLEPRDFLCRYETHCFALCHCCDFDACDCEMTCPQNCTCYHDQTWNTNVVDCGGGNSTNLPKRIPMDASEVYLDGNNFPELQNHAFIGRKNLRALYVNNSKVIQIQNRTFAGLSLLQYLHLEDNHLQTLHGYEFEHLSQLRELYLQNNYLTHIGNETLAPLRSLEILRIDGNRITTINLFMWHPDSLQLNALRSLSLGRNAWSCRCKHLQELTAFVSDMAVIIQDSQDIYCVDGAVKRELDFNATEPCIEYLPSGVNITSLLPNMYIPLLVSLLAIILLLLIGILAFLFREPLRVWIYSQYGLNVFGPRCEESEKLYDAVLLHSAKDSEFVYRELAAELEMGRPPLRLCVQHRDLTIEPSHIQILEATKASRRLIVVLSRNFLQTEWIRNDLRRAVHESLKGRPNKLIVVEEPEVLLEAESDVELVTYLKATNTNRIRRNDRHFWEKLRYALPTEIPYRGNNYTIDNHHPHHHHHHHLNHLHHQQHHLHNTLTSERVKQPASPGVMFRQAPPPAYYHQDPDDTNYSSATTATPSPRPTRRAIGITNGGSTIGRSSQHNHLHNQQQQQQPQQLHHKQQQQNNVMVESTLQQQQQQQLQSQPPRPLSEHIYSSIDSDYGGIDSVNNMVVGVHRPSWQSNQQQQQQQQQQHHHQQPGQNVQAYLV